MILKQIETAELVHASIHYQTDGTTGGLIGWDIFGREGLKKKLIATHLFPDGIRSYRAVGLSENDRALLARFGFEVDGMGRIKEAEHANDKA